MYLGEWTAPTYHVETSSKHVRITVPYKVNMHKEWNIMPLYKCKKLCLLGNKRTISGNKKYKYSVKNIQRTMITQLGICTVKIEQNNKQKIVIPL